jgi:hypothetical protein
MILKNPDKILHQPIFTKDGNFWFATDVNVLMHIDNSIEYEFKLVTQIPVKSSPNQQYYHMTRTMDETAKLTLIKTDYAKNNIYELLCGGAMWRGYCSDIDTMDKFISVLADKLPNY